MKISARDLLKLIPMKQLLLVPLLTLGLSLEAQVLCGENTRADVYNGPWMDSKGYKTGNYDMLDEHPEIRQVVDKMQMQVAQSRLGQMVLKQNLECRVDLIESEFGVSRHAALSLARDCLEKKFRAFDESQVQISHQWRSCADTPPFLRAPSRTFRLIQRDPLKIESWTNLLNATYLNFYEEQASLPELFDRLYHEMYIQYDADFLPPDFKLEDDKRAITFLMNLYGNPTKVSSQLNILSDPVLQSSLASLRAFEAEAIEQDRNYITNETECLRILERILNEALIPGACGVHQSFDMLNRIPMYASSTPPASAKLVRTEIQAKAKEAFQTFKDISALATAQNGRRFCVDIAQPRVHESCLRLSFGPRPRITGSGQ